jgi:hypothetical protein
MQLFAFWLSNFVPIDEGWKAGTECCMRLSIL